MKRLQPLFQLLNPLVLPRTGMVGGANLGCFGAGNNEPNPQERHHLLAEDAIAQAINQTERGRQAIGLMGHGLVQGLNLGNGGKLLNQFGQLVDAADVVSTTGAAYLSARLADSLSISALRFGNLPSIDTSKPRLKSGGSRRLCAAST